jgi:hypothetical protein
MGETIGDGVADGIGVDVRQASETQSAGDSVMGVGVYVGSGCGADEGVGPGVNVGTGDKAGSGVTTGAGVRVRAGVTTGVGLGNREVVKESAVPSFGFESTSVTFAVSTVASDS